MNRLRCTSWKTTVAGLGAILAGAAMLIVPQFTGGSLSTVEVTTALGLIAAGSGALFARDNNRTSEEVRAPGAGAKPTYRRRV